MGGFLMLAHTPEVLYIDNHFIYNIREILWEMELPAFWTGMKSLPIPFRKWTPIEGTPIRINTLFNTLARDFLKAKEMVRDKYSDIQPNWVGYYM